MRSVALNRKMLPYAVALTLVASAALIPTPARGVTLGNVAAQSALGQPLRVVIPVDLGHAETLNSACIKLVADNSAGDAPQIVTGRVSLELESTTSPRLVITTPTAIKEPAARLAVQVGCGSTTRRDYVLFFDPPALDSSSVLAAADGDDPPWTRAPRQNPVAQNRQNVVVLSAAPRSTWGTPIPTGAPAPEVRPAAPQRAISEPTPEAAVATATAASSIVPRELVTLTASTASGMFIPEAAAASLTARNVAPQAITAAVASKASAQSIPLANMNTQRASGSSAVAAWQMAWPFAAGIFGTMALLVLGFVVHRRSLLERSWMDPKSRTTLKGETQAGNPQATFAHFGVMTEPVKIKPRVPLELPPAIDNTVPISELDTLLADIQSDLIDERSIKEAYKAAAADAGMDMGSDSILRAIAEAERDLQIGTPEPKQVALDSALDRDLMTVPHVPTGVRFSRR